MRANTAQEQKIWRRKVKKVSRVDKNTIELNVFD